MVSANHGACTHDNGNTTYFFVNLGQVSIHNGVVIARSMIIVAVQMTGQDCIVGNHDIHILEFVGRSRMLKLVVQPGCIYFRALGVKKRTREMSF